MKKLLITGASGLLGSACVREFRRDHEVITERVDWTDRAMTRRFFHLHMPDMVIHCAAKVGGVKANKEQPVEFMLENLWMQNNVIEAAHDAGTRRLCFIATSCMFPKDASLPVQEDSLFTGKLEDNTEAYAVAKIAGWRLCKAYWEQHGDRFITVAPSNIFGINDNYGETAHVIPALMRRFKDAMVKKEPLIIWGDGSAVREFIYADDVATAIRVLINHWKSPEVVNIGTGLSTRIDELARALADSSPFAEWNRPKITWDTGQPTGIQRKTFSIENLTAFDWKPKYSLQEGLKRTWDDFLSGKPRGIL